MVRFFGYNSTISRAFNNNNWEADIVDYFDGRSISLVQLVSSFFSRSYYFNINKFNSNKYYDIILIVKGAHFSSEKLCQLKKCCTKLYLWIMDPIKLLPEIHQNLHLFDNIFTFQHSDIDFLIKFNPNISYLPLFYDDLFFGRTIRKKLLDFIFIGNLYEQRANELNKFCKEAIDSGQNLSIQIYGGFGFLKLFDFIKVKYKYKYLSKYLRFGLVTPRKASSLYAISKVGLNIHVNSQTGLNMRFFELLSSDIVQILPNSQIELENIKIPQDCYICSDLDFATVSKILHASTSILRNSAYLNHSSTVRIRTLIEYFTDGCH